MGNFCLALLMVSSLLSCPFQCMACLDLHPSAPKTTTCGCRCCAPVVPEHDAPIAPDSDANGCDCVCKGAVLTERVTNYDASGFMIPQVAVCHDFKLSVMPAPAAEWIAVEGLPLSGRSLRLRWHSLQI